MLMNLRPITQYDKSLIFSLLCKLLNDWLVSSCLVVIINRPIAKKHRNTNPTFRKYVSSFKQVSECCQVSLAHCYWWLTKDAHWINFLFSQMRVVDYVKLKFAVLKSMFSKYMLSMIKYHARDNWFIWNLNA